eukprot:c9612_g1_i1.p1 GENE.c9612_g1_i1~~c9612_g1_i1.p1  ORF type:complete len:191 (+),score=33.14 c9612_g1_i1:23-574(+)
MGALFSALRGLFGSKDVRILILGLDNAGKTTILNKLQLPDSPSAPTVPTIGFNMKEISFRNIKFQCWDLGGQEGIRPYWRLYYQNQNTDAIIYVVDAADTERVAISSSELKHMMEEEELSTAVLLVFANKQDLPNAMSAAQVSDHLGLSEIKNRPWAILPSNARSGDGLMDGLEWLSNAIANR